MTRKNQGNDNFALLNRILSSKIFWVACMSCLVFFQVYMVEETSEKSATPHHQNNDVRVYHASLRAVKAEDHIIPTHEPTPVAHYAQETTAPSVPTSVPTHQVTVEEEEHLPESPVVEKKSDNTMKEPVEKQQEEKEAQEAETSKDKYSELYQKYNEDCVKLGDGHLEAMFIKEGACFSRKRVQEILIDLVFNVSKVFTDHGITNFLDSGTYLGAVRHKSIIPFDQDADIGIDQAGYEKIRDNAIQFPSQYYMQVYDSKVHPVGTRFKQLPIRVIHRESALYVDIFVYLDSTNEEGKPMTGPLPSWCYINCNHCPEIEDVGKEFKVPRDWIYPLRDCEFAGRTLKCPAKSHEYLQYMFGDGYMTPVVFPY